MLDRKNRAPVLDMGGPTLSERVRRNLHTLRLDWVLYAMLLDRASISKQNGYVEPDGTIRLYFTVEQAQERLHRSRQCVTRIFRELEYSGLIVRRKQGLGKPALITLNYPADAKLIAKEGEDAQA